MVRWKPSVPTRNSGAPISSEQRPATRASRSVHTAEGENSVQQKTVRPLSVILGGCSSRRPRKLPRNPAAPADPLKPTDSRRWTSGAASTARLGLQPARTARARPGPLREAGMSVARRQVRGSVSDKQLSPRPTIYFYRNGQECIVQCFFIVIAGRDVNYVVHPPN